jgi:hypothetical protein
VIGGKLRVALVVGAAAFGACSATAAAAPLRWSAPRQIAHKAPFSNVPPNSVSCPSASQCFMPDDGGDIVVLSNPGAAKPSRTVTTLPGVTSLEGIDCPATNLCIAFDADSHLITSTNPDGGPGAWTVATLPSELGGVSCPSTSLCLGVDSDGNLLVSINPTGGASAWPKTTLSSPLSEVSCPSATFCVALDKSGHVLTSTNPTGGAGAWTPSGATLPANVAISCPSASLCLAWSPLDNHGNLYTTTTPATSTPWAVADVDGTHSVYTVECPTTSLCVSADNAGNVITSTNPTGGAGAWSPANVDGTAFIYSISCPTTSLCVGADGNYDALTSVNPTGGKPAWRLLSFPGFNAFTSLSCPATTACVAVDGFADHFATSSHPPGAWKLTTVKHGIGEDPEVYRVACASRSLCLALVTDQGPPGMSGAAGKIYSFNPRGRPHGFRRIRIRGADTSLGIFELACLPGPLCAVVDFHGHVFTSRNPAVGRTWHRDHSGRRFFSTSCPAKGFCVTLHSDPDRPVEATEPGSGSTFAIPDGSIKVIAGGSSSTVSIDGPNGLTGISCASKSLCVAVDNAGNVLTSTHPAAGPSAWQKTHVDDWALTAVSCPSTKLCVAVDQDGRVVVGRR